MAVLKTLRSTFDVETHVQGGNGRGGDRDGLQRGRGCKHAARKRFLGIATFFYLIQS